MDQNKIQKSIQRGKKHEKRVAQIFLNYGWWVRMVTIGEQIDENPEKRVYYDLEVFKPGFRMITLEIKSKDWYYTPPQNTGNILIEFFQGEDKHPSGMSTSTADFWVHTMVDKVVLYDTEEMRQYINKMDWPIVKFPKGDNDNWGIIKPWKIFLNKKNLSFQYNYFIYLPESKILKNKF